MKLWKQYKDIMIKKQFKKERQTFYLSYNKETIEKMEAITFTSHHDIYKILRGFRIPFYEKCYFFRKKKGFNTFFFEQDYDVVITNKNNIIIETIKAFKKGRISKYYETGFNIFFFIVGTINHFNLQKKGELLVKSKTTRLLFNDL